MSGSRRRHGRWRRGRQAIKGRAYIPTREEMDKVNEPLRRAHENKGRARGK